MKLADLPPDKVFVSCFDEYSLRVKKSRNEGVYEFHIRKIVESDRFSAIETKIIDLLFRIESSRLLVSPPRDSPPFEFLSSRASSTRVDTSRGEDFRASLCSLERERERKRERETETGPHKFLDIGAVEIRSIEINSDAWHRREPVETRDYARV